uniref:Uncharacterized protein n=1 Tax=Trichobilharzia regenti TaxID=157069 RepID=A0AA85K389_TRIRE|nr:unnamed protein product [Trichobilharzia regenti]
MHHSCLELWYSYPHSRNCRTHNTLRNTLEIKEKKPRSTDDDDNNNENNFRRGLGILCRIVNEANHSVDFASNISANISEVLLAFRNQFLHPLDCVNFEAHTMCCTN